MGKKRYIVPLVEVECPYCYETRTMNKHSWLKIERGGAHNHCRECMAYAEMYPNPADYHAQRAFDCTNYESCLAFAAKLDKKLACPCGAYEQGRHVTEYVFCN